MKAPGRLVRLANRGFPKLWARGIVPPPVLNADRLIADAVRKTGLHDFGDPKLPTRLQRLCAALNEEAGLTPFGKVMSYGGTLRALTQRLRCEAILTANPEIEQRPVAAPVIIVGPMRSGTTRVQRLLACDDRFVHTHLFEALTPCPGGGRILAARAMQWSFDRLNPAIRQIHPGNARDADEELGPLELALSGAQIEAQRPIPSWARWMECTPQTHAYRWLKRWMQLTGWARGDDPAKPWLLKTPQYMQDLPEILQVFPDARLIFTHRDPHDVTASAASLAWNYMMLQSDQVTPDWCGREWLHKTAHRVDAARAFRASHPNVPAIDIRFQDMNEDWEREIVRIYDWLESAPPQLPSSSHSDGNDGSGLDSRLAAMRAYTVRASRRHLAKPHRYSLADFGLNAAQVDERLGAYSADFDLI